MITSNPSCVSIPAMMIECMAGKSAAVHGLVHDATPFKFTEDNTAIDYFGKLLEAGEGYTYIIFLSITPIQITGVQVIVLSLILF